MKWRITEVEQEDHYTMETIDYSEEKEITIKTGHILFVRPYSVGINLFTSVQFTNSILLPPADTSDVCNDSIDAAIGSYVQ